MGNFGSTVESLVSKYKKRLRATAKEAVQQTVQLASTVREEGGRMRVDTGFLWHSVAGNIGSMPSGQSSNPNGDTYTFTGADIAANLIMWDLREPFYVGWTANYARPREYEDGFVRGAVEKWPETVDKVAASVRARI